MKQGSLETLIGFAIIFIAGFFLIYSYKAQNQDPHETYNLEATFQSVEGIIVGSDVTIGGIIVGKVHSLALDPSTYDAKMLISIDKNVLVPKDSRALITSSGFLGGKYVAISPGGDDKFLNHGDRIQYTQSSINLESLIGKFMYSASSTGASKEKIQESPAE